MNFADLLAAPQYRLAQHRKKPSWTPRFNRLTEHHWEKCAPYGRLLYVLYAGPLDAGSMAEVPFIPISLFETHQLASIPEENMFRTITSSGIMTSVLGPARLPMILIESEAVLKNRPRLNARGGRARDDELRAEAFFTHSMRT